MKIPKIFYSTSGIDGRASDLTFMALQSGFRAIDVVLDAEKDIGDGLSRFLAESSSSMEELFIQCRISVQPPPDGKDVRDFIKQSVDMSSENLNLDILDSLLLDAPQLKDGLTDIDWAAWETMEQLHRQNKVQNIGVSNFNLSQLAELCDKVSVKPKFIQNRCLATSAWDRDIRQFCESNGILFQGKSLLSANQFILQDILVKKVAAKHQVSAEEILLRFCQQIGIIPVTKGDQLEHMKLNSKISGIQLEPEEVESIENLSGKNGNYAKL